MARAEVVPLPLPDGSVIAVRLRSGPVGAPVVVIVPGLGVPAQHYDVLAAELVGAGFGAATIELRGHGDATPTPSRASTYGYHELVSVDFPAAFAVVTARFPGSPLYLLGHSLGGQLAMLYAARARNRIRGLVLVASGSPHHRAYGSLAPALFLGGAAVSLTSRIAGVWPGDLLGERGFGRQSRVLMSDWGAFARTGRLDPAGADMDYEQRLSVVRTRTLSITVAGDELVPPRSARALADKLARADVTHARESKVLGHNGWIADPRGVVALVHDWISA